MSDQYQYRSDGNFMIRCGCESCGERFDAHALSNAYGGTFCDACKQVKDWMKSGPVVRGEEER